MIKRYLTVVLLIAPLGVFLSFTYFAPLAGMIVRSAYTPLISDVMPETSAALQQWSGRGLPDKASIQIFAQEMVQARKDRTLGRVATVVNRIESGTRSLLIRTARKLSRLAPETITAEALSATHEDWQTPRIWYALREASARWTSRHYLNALDLKPDPEGGIARQPPEKRIYLTLFARTLAVSLAVTFLCLLLGYPLAYLMAKKSGLTANLLLLAVLMPFWTSLLVRTTSWIVLLQNQGVVNNLLVVLGLIDDDGRLAMVYNMTGTLVAMTHVLLPFAVLPLYSVMRTIPPVYMNAATSLGASFPRAFVRVYWPQSLSGVAAGGLLVFILSIGYYITPALVGGQSGQLISNLIAFHVQSSLNWGLAAALGVLLLVGIKVLYILYDRAAGVDRLKLS